MGKCRPDHDDARLTELVRLGDHRALEAVFHRYYADLCSFASRIVGSASASEGIIADIFLRIWNRRADWRPESTVRAYLFRAARNGCLDYLKQEQRRNAWIEYGPCEEPIADGTPDDDLHMAELVRSVERAVNILPEGQRQIFLMHRRHDLTYAEIASILNISIKTVETQMTRALRTLRQQLSAYVEAQGLNT